MSTSITTFPFSADKISELPVVTSILGIDKVLVNASSVTSTITKTNLISDLDFQPHSDNLDLYDSIPPTEEALFLINTLITPEVSSYLRINSGTGQTLGRTPTQVLSDIAAQPRNANLDEFATVNPGLPGKNILRLDAPSVSGYVMVNAGIDSDAFIRTPAQVRSDIGAFATASLDTDSSLGGALASDGKAPSQRAAKKYIDAASGGRLDSTLNDDTVASAASIDLDATNGKQIRVTGTIPVTDITLANKSQKTLVFDGAVTFTASASLTLPTGMTTLTTEAGGYANVTGGAGVASIEQYFAPGFKIHYGGDFTTGGDFYSAGQVTMLQNFSALGLVSLQTDFVLAASSSAYTVQLNSTGVTIATLPLGTHTLAAEVGNYSVTSQAIAATTRTYITGSAITVPSSKMKIGSKFLWKFNLTKTAAGTAASTFDVCIGTLGTTGDAAVLSFTKPGGSAAVDEGFVIIEAICRGPLSASGILVGEFVMYHNLASTGHMTIPVSCSNVVSSVFDVTAAGLIIGVCATTGASDAVTVQQVTAQAFNI